MDPQNVIALVEILEAMDSSSSSEDDELVLASTINAVCQTETHAKIRDYVDNVVSEYLDHDVSRFS